MATRPVKVRDLQVERCSTCPLLRSCSGTRVVGECIYCHFSKQMWKQQNVFNLPIQKVSNLQYNPPGVSLAFLCIQLHVCFVMASLRLLWYNVIHKSHIIHTAFPQIRILYSSRTAFVSFVSNTATVWFCTSMLVLFHAQHHADSSLEDLIVPTHGACILSYQS